MLAQSVLSPIVVERPNLLTLAREMPADLETPVSVYLKLAGGGPSFLLESVTGGEQVARYSFIGTGIQHAYILSRGRLAHKGPNGTESMAVDPGCDPLALLRRELARFRPGAVPPVLSQAARAGSRPPFSGGLAGYLAYEAARYFEPTAMRKSRAAPAEELPEAIFLLADSIVAVDHAYGRLLLIANVPVGDDEEVARASAERKLDALAERLRAPLPAAAHAGAPEVDGSITSNMSPEAFMAGVTRAKEHIAAGDIFQVVLSQRFSRRTTAAPFAIYRALRRLNPSPYMFFFDFAGLTTPIETPFYLIGASPEMHVRLQGRRAFLRPIAGTRPRGTAAEEDAELERELLADPKERAEHVMLVDLARNDLGRVCEYGTVGLAELMTVERYSHVMHIVSQVEGTLRPEHDAFDLLAATFPAGTVSGAPKIRAMQIIDAVEPLPRGPYAGAVGHFGFDGSLDTCITIRTLVMRGDTVSVQAGAGIVADSQPAGEYQESVNKARALLAAVEQAQQQQETDHDRRNR